MTFVDPANDGWVVPAADLMVTGEEPEGGLAEMYGLGATGGAEPISMPDPKPKPDLSDVPSFFPHFDPSATDDGDDQYGASGMGGSASMRIFRKAVQGSWLGSALAAAPFYYSLLLLVPPGRV